MAVNCEREAYFAKLAEQTGRYDEMAAHMETVARLGDELSAEERNLLFVAFKNAVGSRRTAWRIATAVKQREISRGNDEQALLATEYCDKIGAELDEFCSKLLELLDGGLICKATKGESKVFYHKMKADYYRYIAEHTTSDAKVKASNDATSAYEEAQALARDLAATHPIRLGLALNFAVFQFEVLANLDEACSMARVALEDAIAELDIVGEDSSNDTTLIMQLLRDNLSFWTSDQEGGKP
ncbi:unnamed protein product [Prorocentrum cordatum]|uniref:14-3-3 domain-containing protein n=1 Tax=Prorocentrum cordatum TaxID=2364126 RepID=A0ABN9PK25_9DINO|nr:unnamed protein product [Polarella glacialis]